MDIFSVIMVVYGAVSLATGVVGARMGSRRQCGALRPLLWGLLFPVAGLVRPLLSSRLPQQSASRRQSPLTAAQVNDLLKDSVKQTRENEKLKTQVTELQERIGRLEDRKPGTAQTPAPAPQEDAAVSPDLSRAAQLAAENRYSEKAPAREKAPKEHPEITHGRGMRR